MARPKNFPETIYVTREEVGSENEFLMVNEGGVAGILEDGKRVAVYKLVSTGTVEVKQKFVEKQVK